MASHNPVQTTEIGGVPLLTVDDVAALLGCGRTMVYDLLGRGEIGFLKIGRLTRIHPSQVDMFLEKRMGLDRVEPPQGLRRRRRSAAQSALPF